MSLRSKLPHRRRAATPRSQRFIPQIVNAVWSMDFMHDRLADNRAIDCSRSWTFILANALLSKLHRVFVPTMSSRYSSAHARSAASRTCCVVIMARNLLRSHSIKWAFWNKIALDFSRPGKPTDNAFIESFNGGVRRELLNPSYFETIEQARKAAHIWRQEYNEFRRTQCWLIKRRKSLRPRIEMHQEADSPRIAPVY